MGGRADLIRFKLIAKDDGGAMNVVSPGLFRRRKASVVFGIPTTHTIGLKNLGLALRSRWDVASD
jgi:hypothetical protein